MRTKYLFLACVFFLVPAFSSACSCRHGSPEEAVRTSLQSADIVFRGKLVSHGFFRRAVFRVDEVWKGDVGQHVTLEWRRGDRGDCNGFWPDQLKVGNDMLVFARRKSLWGYKTSICFPTKPISSAQAELRELGPGKPPRE